MIEGVVVRPLKLVPNERGRLMEVQRDDDDIFPGFGQAYVTSTLQGVVKAWYRHHRQVDQIAVVKGRFTLALYDGRDDSPTRGVVQVVDMAEASPVLVQIPPGIWHGFQAVGDEGFLLHLNSIAFDFANADEDRLPSDHPSIPYNWPR